MISSERVTEIFYDCLSSNIEDDMKIVEGIIELSVNFNKSKLQEYEKEIISFLDQLPLEFRRDIGGGWSFLNACVDIDGNQWTGLHKVMEELFLLGMGIDKVEYLLSRETWSVFPGGVPYLVYNK